MKHVFISYHRQDEPLAHAVQTQIEQAGLAFWLSPHEQRFRDDWAETDQAIQQSSVLVVIMTPSARTSDQVAYEWAFALGAGIPVVPLLFKTTDMPPRLTLLHGLDFTNNALLPWDELLEMLHKTEGTYLASPADYPDIETTGSPPRATVDTARISDTVRSFSSTTTATTGDHAAVRGVLTDSLQHHLREVRIQAALMLAQFQEEQAVPVLIDALRDRHRDVHQHALWGLIHIGLPAIPHLLTAMHDEHDGVRKDVMRIVGQIGSPDVVPAVAAALQDPSVEVRRAAVEALGHIKAEEAVPNLCATLQDPEECVRRAAAEALGQIGHSGAIHDLIHCMQDECESVRVVATWALGQVKNTEAIPALIQALRQTNQQVRQVAANMLKEIGDQSAEPGLNEALLDDDLEVRRTAARVLGHIRSRLRTRKSEERH